MQPLFADREGDEPLSGAPHRRRIKPVAVESDSEMGAETWPDRTALGVIIACLALLLVVAIWFGGVHATAFQFSSAIICVVTGFSLWNFSAARTALSDSRSREQGTRLILSGMLIFCVYILAQYLLYRTMTDPHPVIGRASMWIDPPRYWSGVLGIIATLGMFISIRLGLNRSMLGTDRDALAALVSRMVWFSSALSVIAVIVALIAITHWFSDNGKLFWTFAPENIFVPMRARWPFVNSNHLAHFLVPLLFVSLIPSGIALNVLVRKLAEPGRRGLRITQSMQRWILLLTGSCAALGVITIAIVAAQSRGAFIALGFGALALLLSGVLTARARQRTLNLVAPVLGRPILPFSRRVASAHEQERRWQNLNLRAISIFRRVAPGLLLVLGLILVGMFIRDQGANRLEDRMEYGLAHALDDSRWQLYSDTFDMIKAGPWFVVPFGVGFANWSQSYLRYMDSSLAGLDPMYLHSDPLQVIAETGIVGAGILVVIFIALLLAGYRAMRSITNRVLSDLNVKSQPLSAAVLNSCLIRLEGVFIGRCLFSALIAALACSAMDFPFRIPAFAFLFAVILALYVTVVDHLHDPQRDKLDLTTRET